MNNAEIQFKLAFDAIRHGADQAVGLHPDLAGHFVYDAIKTSIFSEDRPFGAAEACAICNFSECERLFCKTAIVRRSYTCKILQLFWVGAVNEVWDGDLDGFAEAEGFLAIDTKPQNCRHLHCFSGKTERARYQHPTLNFNCFSHSSTRNNHRDVVLREAEVAARACETERQSRFRINEGQESIRY